MEHKAFLLDEKTFQNELSPILYEALEHNNAAPLQFFIEENLEQLTDPYEGEPLDEDWKTMLELRTPEEYGDFALTKYYRVCDDIGLGEDWDEMDDYFREWQEDLSVTILGKPFGPTEDYFDPGKMGSYFQSPEEVAESLEKLIEHARAFPQRKHQLAQAIELLEKAVQAGQGLYVTF